MVISYSFPFFHPYVFFFFSLVFFSTTHVYPYISILSLFISTFHLIPEPPYYLFLLFFCAYLFVFYFLSTLAHFTHTADYDLLTSPLCLHFCFLFSFFFISLHSHTLPAERLAFVYLFSFFLFLPSFLVLIHFVVTMELK